VYSRQNLLNDISNPHQMKRLKKVSENNYANKNKSKTDSEDDNSLRKALARRRIGINPKDSTENKSSKDK
jgi:hypothetical protein